MSFASAITLLRARRPRFLLRGALAALFLFVPTIALHAQAGASGLSFLKQGADARSVALAETGVALDNGPASAHRNPALPAFASRAALGVLHNAWFQDITANRLSALVPVWGMAISAHVHLTQVPDIEIRQVPGDPQGTFSSKDFSTGLTASVLLSDELAAGVTAKYLFEKIYVDVSDGFAFDLGLAYHPSALPKLQAGLAFHNLGSMSELRSIAPTLPSSFRAGAAWIESVPALDAVLSLQGESVSWLEEGKTHAALGLEFEYRNMISARLGWMSGYETRDLSAGLGLRYDRWLFDYAFTPFSEGLGSAHTLSLAILL